MSLTKSELDTLSRLRARLARDRSGHGGTPGFRGLRAYYRGMQRLTQLGLAVPEELRNFVTIVAWPRTYVDAIVSRLRPQGFLLDGEADNDLWRIWQANNLDGEFRMALVDMLVYGRGYLCAGTNDQDAALPLVTVESPLQMVHEWSNRYRRVTSAARFYTEVADGVTQQRVTLYLPDVTVWATMVNGEWVEDADGRDEHNLGRVPVQPLVNRSDTEDRYGESEMLTIIGLTDAAARALTLAQVATEVMGIPQRTAAGLAANDFKDPETGEPVTQWEAYFGAVWATENKDAKFHQFSAADLANFKTIVSLYAQLVAGVTGLPMRYLGQMSDNPPSADGIRADEARLVGTAEEKQEPANDCLEATMRVARHLVTGSDDPRFMEMATDWRPAGTASLAQAADAAVKLHAQGIISRREALRRQGMSPKQIEVIEAELAEEALDPVTRALASELSGGPAAPAALSA